MKTPALAAAALALGTLGLSRPASGQGATIPSPFHAGQWGIEAYASTNGDGGVTRFFTPLTAVVLTVSGAHGTMKGNSTPTTTGYSSTTNGLDLALGLRHHAMLAPKIASVFGGGIALGSYAQRDEYSTPANDVTSFHARYIGAYVEAGGQYMVADHLAIGLSYRLAGQHMTASAASDLHGFQFASSFLPVRATLYF